MIEEYDGTGTLLRSYVYGNYVDEVVQLRDEVGGEDYYYHADDQWNVVALTDTETVNDPAGTVVERYEYDDFGVPTVADASWTPVANN